MDVNNSTEANETTFFFSMPVIVVKQNEITLYSILIVSSLLGNILVIAVVYCNQNLRTNMNYLIVNMAVSDLLIPLVAVPWWIVWSLMNIEWLVDDPLSNALCKLASFLAEISPLVSSISLVNIAFQRFIAVVYPIKGRQILTRKKRWILISFPWIAAMALCAPLLYTSRVVTDEWGDTLCISSLTAEFMVFFVTLTFGFVIPLVIIIILYAIILYDLRKNLNNVMGLIEKETVLSRQRSNRRIFIMSITIIVMFTICWCPYSVVSLMFYANFSSLLSLDDETKFTLDFVCRYIWYSLAAINPCIYFLFLKDFRRGLCCMRTAIVAPGNAEQISRRPRPAGGESNQDATYTPSHMFNTTSA